MFEDYITIAMKLFSDEQLKSIDIDTLDMKLPCKCVLGQIHGNYYDAMKAWGLSHAGSVFYGFALNATEDEDEEWQWDELTIAWKRALAVQQKSLSETGYRADDREIWESIANV